MHTQMHGSCAMGGYTDKLEVTFVSRYQLILNKIHTTDINAEYATRHDAQVRNTALDCLYCPTQRHHCTPADLELIPSCGM